MAANGTSPAFTYDQQPYYDYTPLATPSHSFRLFYLQPRRSDEVIRGSMIECSSGPSPAYIALSYEWGAAQDFHWIEVDGSRIQIRSNLFNILTELLRRENVSRPFFIDAICIDQSNVPERNAQVRLVTTIYKEASEVSVWLNVVVPHLKELMNLVAYYDKHPELPHSSYTRLNASGHGSHMIHDLYNDGTISPLHALFTRTQSLPTGEEICHAHMEGYGVRTKSRMEFRCLICELNTLLGATYWSRMWIVPEFILGSEITINCMKVSITLSELQHAIDVVLTSYNSILSKNQLRHETMLSGHRRRSPGWTIIELRRKYRQDVEAKVMVGILNWIGESGQQYCADDSDRVYSLLGLDHYCADFPVDYTYSILRFFLELIFFLDNGQKGTTLPSRGSSRLWVG